MCNALIPTKPLSNRLKHKLGFFYGNVIYENKNCIANNLISTAVMLTVVYTHHHKINMTSFCGRIH